MISIRFVGLQDLSNRFGKAPRFLEREIQKALKRSIAMVETNVKKLTPVDTGLLRSSIGGVQGYSFVRGLTAGVGTNVKYAIYVETGYGKHTVGQSGFMEGGVKNSVPFIRREFERAMKTLADNIAR